MIEYQNTTTPIATERIFLTAERDAIVPDGDPAAAFLLASPGTEIPPEYRHLIDGGSSNSDGPTPAPAPAPSPAEPAEAAESASIEPGAPEVPPAALKSIKAALAWVDEQPDKVAAAQAVLDAERDRGEAAREGLLGPLGDIIAAG